MKSVYIVAAKRTPIGVFMGALAKHKGPKLGSYAIQAAVSQIGLDVNKVDEVLMGNVVSAGLGQSPARQASLGGGIPIDTPCSLVNKVCASGMKTITLGAQTILAGTNNTVIAGGFESMSNAPFYVMNTRKGTPFGNQQLLDGIAYDGLTDAYNNCAMGVCAEKTAEEMGISRELQDAYCINSYQKTIKAIEDGRLEGEIMPIDKCERDEEPFKFKPEKIPLLKPVFAKSGTVTAANASKLNDGGAAVIIMSEEAVKRNNVKPMARIVSFADCEVDPMDFNISPAKAAQLVLKRAKLDINQMDAFEFNEAFSLTGIANMKLLDLDPELVNVNGGAVALGHPIGMSGTRIVMALMTVLRQKGGKYGLAAICNGGGGSSAVIVENMM